ncbi:hypothetical protein AGMMS4952_02650 [Spirochaetia bacterium]|nr:hypothetical protein AGMMS4952_02650 [Spirochaetia bacterium]
MDPYRPDQHGRRGAWLALMLPGSLLPEPCPQDPYRPDQHGRRGTCLALMLPGSLLPEPRPQGG